MASNLQARLEKLEQLAARKMEIDGLAEMCAVTAELIGHPADDPRIIAANTELRSLAARIEAGDLADTAAALELATDATLELAVWLGDEARRRGKLPGPDPTRLTDAELDETIARMEKRR